MEQIIDRNIDNNEVIIRFIFQGNLKDNKRNLIFQKEFIIDKDIFIDTRKNDDGTNVDVSLLRKRYNSEEECTERGKQVKEDFIGFLIFKKYEFENVVIKHREIGCNNFEAEIISTPLDENYNIIPLENIVKIDTPINPGHADLKYINPGLITNDENPNTAIRRFSKNLFKICEVYFYENNHA